MKETDLEKELKRKIDKDQMIQDLQEQVKQLNTLNYSYKNIQNVSNYIASLFGIMTWDPQESGLHDSQTFHRSTLKAIDNRYIHVKMRQFTPL